MMLKSHRNFHSVNGKRQILVVDDEAVNRELLGLMLSEDYDILYAEDGRQALELIRANAATLSLVLLDILMPELNGLELLTLLKQDQELAHLPVIVLTSEKSAEVRSLRLGASDFITKPYDLPEVIQARVRRTIELSEDTYIIQTTEHDELTGLYNKEYFYRYAEQFDRYHAAMAMDAVTLDINHFHLFNELYGRSFADEMLKTIADALRRALEGTGGIACRREADTFLLYAPHREEYDTMLSAILTALGEGGHRPRLRLGVYPCADKGIDIELRFDRAKLAGDTVRNNYARSIAYYDNSLYEKELYSEKLIAGMDQALRARQFQVYYQPKYDIRGERPVLRSAEALIRWNHPLFGRISPGRFIPLFEENGLIQKLDLYVWREAARQVRRWREEYGTVIPVSVNVSRIDMYNPELLSIFRELMRSNQLSPGDYLLEITESAYAEDSERIIRTVEDLRALGFQVEMDDFGSGYSSLNMLSSLPIDVLKLDIKFLQDLPSDPKSVRMLELMLDIARYLSVPVIAEGVEREDQLALLKRLGCDMIQGYYFSRPVPPEEFARFIEKEVSLC